MSIQDKRDKLNRGAGKRDRDREMAKERKCPLSIECQLINVTVAEELENCHFINTTSTAMFQVRNIGG